MATVAAVIGGALVLCLLAVAAKLIYNNSTDCDVCGRGGEKEISTNKTQEFLDEDLTPTIARTRAYSKCVNAQPDRRRELLVIRQDAEKREEVARQADDAIRKWIASAPRSGDEPMSSDIWLCEHIKVESLIAELLVDHPDPFYWTITVAPLTPLGKRAKRLHFRPPLVWNQSFPISDRSSHVDALRANFDQDRRAGDQSYVICLGSIARGTNEIVEVRWKVESVVNDVLH